MALSQGKVQYFKEQLLKTSKNLEESGRATKSAEPDASNLRMKSQASKSKAKKLFIALQDPKMALVDHVTMLKNMTALEYTANLKLQDKLRSFRANFGSYWCRSKKKLDDMKISYNESKTVLAQSGRTIFSATLKNGSCHLVSPVWKLRKYLWWSVKESPSRLWWCTGKGKKGVWCFEEATRLCQKSWLPCPVLSY